MKRLLTLLSLSLLAILVFTGCKMKPKIAEMATLIERPAYNPFVEAFTSGEISRTTPIYVMFSQELDTERVEERDLHKVVKIRPEVKGEFRYEDSSTIAFKPATEFDRNTTYTVMIDLANFFEVDGTDREFSFKFSTLPMHLRARLINFKAVDGESDLYDVEVNLYTPDNEDPQVIKSLIEVSDNNEVEWKGVEGDNVHKMVIKGVKADKNSRNIDVKVVGNKYGVPAVSILPVKVPGKGEFGLYDIVFNSTPERNIEVVFTQNLDPEQDMTGLASIVGNSSNRATANANKITLYPDDTQVGEIEIRLVADIKSHVGKKLEKTLIKKFEISSEKPAIRFINDGAIMPQTSQIMIPFQAVYLRGVTVEVTRIMERNIGQFLQVNQLNGTRELMRVGRLIARKTIFLDEMGQDITQWGTYAIDIREIMQPEQGAIYKLDISFDRDLSAYPCDREQKTKEQITADDINAFASGLEKYNVGNRDTESYYYYDYDNDYYYHYDDDFSYGKKDDPCNSAFYVYNNAKISKNVLATNLGIIAKQGDTNDVLVMVHNILSTAPESGVNISIYNYQNQVIGSGMTDIKGNVSVPLQPNSSAFYVMAALGKQRSYLRIDDVSSLSTSTFDVDGEVVQRGIKGFIYGDRGVWRPGDTLFMSLMLNDKAKVLPLDHPVVMELYTPQGQLYLKRTQTRGTLGTYSFSLPTEQSVATGAWRVRVMLGGVTFNKRVRIETIKPNRLKIDFKMPIDILLAGDKIKSDLHVEWMQGATARNLKYEIDGRFIPTVTKFQGYEQYVFENPVNRGRYSDRYLSSISGSTDEKGDAVVDFGELILKNYAPGMMRLNLDMKVYEESGDFSIDGLSVPFSPYSTYVGISSPQKGRTRLDTEKKHDFKVVALDHEGKPKFGSQLKVKVYKMDWYWWWDSSDSNLAHYMSSNYTSQKQEIDLLTERNGVATFSLEIKDDDWGTYFIEVEDQDAEVAHSTGIMAYFDWGYYEGRRDMEGVSSAQLLAFKLDKSEYKVGEKIKLTLPSSAGSRAVVSVETGSKVISIQEYECFDKETTIEVVATKDMMPNAYMYVSLLQPHEKTDNDLPIRLYGVEPVRVTSDDTHLYPVIAIRDEIKPEEKFDILVSEKSGREMSYTVAIVDEGILSLTRFETPNPWPVFNAKEALGIRSWDMYSKVMGAYGGKIDQMFSIGGAEESMDGESDTKAIVNRFKPVVRFEGPFLLKRGSKNKHTFLMDNYNGRVRVMIVAGDGSAYGNVEKTVMVRKPVMLLGTLPRMIGLNEEMLVPANVFTTEDGVGNVQVSIECSDNMQVIGATMQTLNFTNSSDKQVYFRVKTSGRAGAGKVKLTAKGKGETSLYETDIELRSVAFKQTIAETVVVEGGKSISRDVKKFGIDGTNKVMLEVSSIKPIDMSRRLSFLLGYPHGCMEQITSKGFPQLFLSEFAKMTDEQKIEANAAISEVLSLQRGYQTAEGGFAYWSGGNSVHQWATIYGSHFILEAEAKGHSIYRSVKRDLLDYMQTAARNWSNPGNHQDYSEQMTQAYRLYVLALGKKAELGAMNRMKELDEKLKPQTRWMLAAAYAEAGRVNVAKQVVMGVNELDNTNYNYHDYTFGSSLRDRAVMLIALTTMGEASEAAKVVNQIAEELSGSDWLSTQATAYGLMAVSKYIAKHHTSDGLKFNYTVDGNKEQKISSDFTIWSETLAVNSDGGALKVKFENKGKGTLFARFIVEAIAQSDEVQAVSNGLGVSCKYVDSKGNWIDVSKLEQGTNFVAILEVTNPTITNYKHIEITHIFPVGWEILNTRYRDNSDYALPQGVSYQDFRDDRIYSYVDNFTSQSRVTIKVELVAAYAGKFYAPPIYSQAMYNSTVNANSTGAMVEVIREE